MDKILKNEMGLSKTMKVGIGIGLSVFLTISVLFCAFLYISTRTTVRQQSIRNITNISELNEDALTRTFQNRQDLLETIAARINKRGIYDVKSVLQELEDFDKAYGCCSMGVLDQDHMAYRTDGSSNSVAGKKITELLWKDEPQISESYFPAYTDEYMLNLFSYPIIQDGELKCVIYATYYSKDLTERMNINSLRGKGFTYVLNREGEVMIFPQQYNNKKYSELMRYINETSDILPSESGDSYFDYNGEHYYARFQSLGINDWYLMTCGREVDVFAEARLITKNSFAALGLMWVFIAISLIVTFYSMFRFQGSLRRNHFYDDLLGIENMNALSVYFQKLPKDVLSGMYLSVLDIDKFKEFNYIYGNDAGDRLLKYIVQVFQEEVPQVHLFRHGSDYFIILDDSKSLEELAENVKKTQDRFARDIADGIMPPFDTSTGVRKVDMEVPLRQLISDAIIARDQIKGNHLRHFAVYDDTLRNRRLSYMEMESEFPTALKNKEFQVYYQPKYDIYTGEVIGAEALARWIKKDGTIVSPGAFIPCFEASRQISQLDEEMLSQVCRQMKEMEDEGLEVRPVSVNLSRVHLQQADIFRRLSGIIEGSGIDPRKLSFEITESALLEDSIPLKNIVEQLRSLGCRVDMDDYGIGASGPKALASNCFDVVKLDKSFVDDIGNGQVEAVIEATIRLANKLGIEVVAEGVEERQQAERLTELGCFHAQGFYYSRPLPLENYRQVLREEEHADREDRKVLMPTQGDDRSYHNCFSEDFCIALDTTGIPIYIIDPLTFEIIYCNETLRKTMGRVPLGEICHKAFRGMDEPCPDCVVTKLLNEGVSEAVEYFRPSGKWMLVSVARLHWRGRNYYKLTCIDITKQKKQMEELALKNKEYSAVVAQSTSGIMRYDIATDTAAVNVNINLEQVEEYTIADYRKVVKNSGIVAEESLPTAKMMFDDISSGRSSQGYNLHLISPQGEKLWCHLDYTLIEDNQGKPYRAVVSFYDNTEQREKELAYQRWNSRLNALMNDYTAYMEINLSKDVIEAEGRHGSWEEESSGRCFSQSLELMASTGIYEEDRFNFRQFFHRERLLGQFLAGHRESTLEYRTVMEGPLQWYKAELQMVSDPFTGDVKASVMISNVDIDMREKEQLKKEAERDAMTRLYNHGIVETLIRQVMELSTGERCCFLIIDLDDLREINSTLGHPEGDKALMAIADCMRAQFRKTDIMGRIGGDEFVVFLRNVPEIDRLRSSLYAFISRLNEIKIGPQKDWPVHASVGGTMGTAGVDDFETLYRQADLALFYTKAMGKNGFHMYEPELEKRNFTYSPSPVTSSLTDREYFDTEEMRKLMFAVSSYCPVVLSVNLTKNTYYFMEYADSSAQELKEEGDFDQLLQEVCITLHPDDRESFLACFGREHLIQTYREGERIISYVGRRAEEDGSYLRVKTVAVLMEEEKTGDICQISFIHVADDIV